MLFCFTVTLVSILAVWALTKLFLKNKALVGEFVQVCYRSSAAILGTAFLQSIYGTASMSSMMILGSVPLYNIMAVVILMLEGPGSAQASSLPARLKKSVKGILTNPTLLGIAAGFAWSLAGLSMPTMLNKTLSSVAGLTSPLALLAIGAGFKGRIATPSCYVMAKQMGHEGVLTGSVCVTTTLFSAFSLTFWLFVLRSFGCIV